MSKGNFSTKKKAESHAKMLRKEFPRMKPIRIVKQTIGWDIITSK